MAMARGSGLLSRLSYIIFTRLLELQAARGRDDNDDLAGAYQSPGASPQTAGDRHQGPVVLPRAAPDCRGRPRQGGPSAERGDVRHGSPDGGRERDILPSGRRAAGGRGAAWELMTSLRDILVSAGPERGPLLTAALKSIAAEVAASEPEAMASLAQNLASALMALDPASRRDLLGANIPIPGTDVDLGTAIRARIPEDKLGELIVSLVQTEGNLNARLSSVIRKVLIDRGVTDQEKIGLQEVLRVARQNGSPQADERDTVEDLLKESQAAWI